MLADVLVVAGAIGLAGFLCWFFFAKMTSLERRGRRRPAGFSTHNFNRVRLLERLRSTNRRMTHAHYR